MLHEKQKMLRGPVDSYIEMRYNDGWNFTSRKGADTMPASIIWNRKPLPQNQLAPLPLTAIRPRGALLARIGREKPCNIDERLMHACLARDKDAMDAAQAEIQAILASGSQPEGIALRAILRYHAVTADKAAALYLLRYAKELRDDLLAGVLLPVEQAANVGDILWMALWLYNLTGQKVLLDLCERVKEQAPDWMSTLHVWPQTRAVGDPPSKETDAYWRVHGPTIAASLKTPGLQSLFEGGLKNETAFAVGWEKLMKRHGTANGLFTADPLLAGANPSRGTEAAVVPELLYTMEVLLGAIGQPLAAEVMERVAFGPAQAGGGRQAANQLVADGASGGLGWTAYAAAMWMATSDDGLAAIGYAPAEVRWRVAGQAVRIETETDYPYGETVRLRVHVKKPTGFPLRLRIPAWADEASLTVCGQEIACEAGAFATVEREWQDGDEVLLTLPMAVRTVSWTHQSVSVERGPLVYAMPLDEGAAWNMALLPGRGFEIQTREGIPVIHAEAAPVPDWKRSGDTPAALPIAPEIDAAAIARITLVPYGETRARIAQFPAGKMTGGQSE